MAPMGAGRRPHTFPQQLTSFIGRRQELAEVKRLLGTSRLLTLTGAGGAGKTRLALRAAEELARGFSDGVWFVDLAPLDDAMLVNQAVFGALGLQDRASRWSVSTLTDYVSDKRMLLLFDNCEHVVDACAVLVDTLLRACPNLRVLATSREALGTIGEGRLRVPSMSLPTTGSLSVSAVVASDAGALFEARAMAIAPEFRITTANVEVIAAICRCVDGMPLALELAAVRLDTLSLEQLADALDQSLRILGERSRGAVPRQRTLEATIDWSYRLLGEDERRLWARLSVFPGSFDAHAAARVIEDGHLPDAAVPDLLSGLVAKSIVQLEHHGETARYRLLATLRRYGRDRLRESGEESALRRRHRDWVAGLAASAAVRDARQGTAFDTIQVEIDNVWSALDYSLATPGEPVVGVRICSDLWKYWVTRGPIPDARRLLSSLLDRLDDSDAATRSAGLFAAGTLAFSQNDFDAASLAYEESLRLARARDDGQQVAWSMGYLGMVKAAQGSTDEAIEFLGGATELGVGLADPLIVAGIGSALLAYVPDLPGTARSPDPAARAGMALPAVQTALAASEALGELWVRSYALVALAQWHCRRGDLRTADELARRGLELKGELGDSIGISYALELLSWIQSGLGDARRASTLLGASARQRSRAQVALVTYETGHDQVVADLKARLGEAGYEAAYAKGSAMTSSDMVAYALGREPQAETGSQQAPKARYALSPRELQISRLIGQGLQTKEIATQLFISERTVETHVTNIMNKLGINSRLQLARWVASVDQTVDHPVVATSMVE